MLLGRHVQERASRVRVHDRVSALVKWKLAGLLVVFGVRTHHVLLPTGPRLGLNASERGLTSSRIPDRRGKTPYGICRGHHRRRIAGRLSSATRALRRGELLRRRFLRRAVHPGCPPGGSDRPGGASRH